MVKNPLYISANAAPLENSYATCDPAVEFYDTGPGAGLYEDGLFMVGNDENTTYIELAGDEYEAGVEHQALERPEIGFGWK